jgi:hypothetical protein
VLVSASRRNELSFGALPKLFFEQPEKVRDREDALPLRAVIVDACFGAFALDSHNEARL